MHLKVGPRFCMFWIILCIFIVVVRKSIINNKNNNQVRNILFWNTIWGNTTFYFGPGDLFQNCPYKCYATHNRTYIPVQDFDAVFFHIFRNDFRIYDIPPRRKSNQKYVYVSLESPGTSYIPRNFDNFFNWTMTYRLDSDVIWPYANILDRKTNAVVAPFDDVYWKAVETREENIKLPLNAEGIIAKKMKLAVWYRSHCETFSGREQFVEEIEKYMEVSKYGKCSADPGCPYGSECYNSIETEYFFYFSLENTLCDDYVTEKLYDILKYYVVPVVYGGADYTRFAPPNSYINALDFDSPKELAEYLIWLSKNLDEYKKYFKWKEHYKVDARFERTLCDLCYKLHENDENEEKSYQIYDWYYQSCPIQKKLRKQIEMGGEKYATKKILFNIY